MSPDLCIQLAAQKRLWRRAPHCSGCNKRDTPRKLQPWKLTRSQQRRRCPSAIGRRSVVSGRSTCWNKTRRRCQTCCQCRVRPSYLGFFLVFYLVVLSSWSYGVSAALTRLLPIPFCGFWSFFSFLFFFALLVVLGVGQSVVLLRKKCREEGAIVGWRRQFAGEVCCTPRRKTKKTKKLNIIVRVIL